VKLVDFGKFSIDLAGYEEYRQQYLEYNLASPLMSALNLLNHNHLPSLWLVDFPLLIHRFGGISHHGLTSVHFNYIFYSKLVFMCVCCR